MKGARPRRRFGQHFLHDRNIIGKIIGALALQPDDHVVEIGPGEGAITASLLARVERLDVVEIDRDLAAALPARLAAAGAVEVEERLTVHCTDALRFDFGALRQDRPLRLVGNLPYNISTPLLFHLLEHSGTFTDLHVMLQKEVGDRMTAGPGSKTYGRLSVALAVRCRVERLFAISAGCFRPPPKVESVFLRLVPAVAPAGHLDSPAALDAVLTRSFSMRRKRLANGLRDLLSAAEIRAAGVDPDDRPEQVSPAQFVRLANRLASQPGNLASVGPLSQNDPQS